MRSYGDLFSEFHLKFTTTDQVRGRNVVINGTPVINFGSANYLGLDSHPAVLNAAKNSLTKWGNHSGCSRIFSSHKNLVVLEQKIAEITGAEAAMVCVNTSQTHQGAIPALFGRKDTTLFLDRYAHTSMHQAGLIATAKGATLVRTDIRDLRSVENQLKQDNSETKVILVDGVYSMQGTVPDLRELQEVCTRTNTLLYVDDAHGIGIYGARGGGVVEAQNLHYKNLILAGTLQKGLGAFGGFIAGYQSLIDFLRATSRSYIFSGTIQPQAVEGALAAIAISDSDEGRALRTRLSEKSRHIRNELFQLGFQVADGDSPIISVLIGPELRTLMAGRKLFDEGLYINSVLFPATPRDEGLLRISLNANHTDEQIAHLINAFSSLKIYLNEFYKPWGPNLIYARQIIRRQAKKIRLLA